MRPGLVLLFLAVPGVGACGFELSDPQGDQESPWPAAQYDLLALSVNASYEHLRLGLRVDGLASDGSTAQYVFNFGHRSWVYIVACRAYTVDGGSGEPDCSLSRSPAADELPAGAFEPIGSLPATMAAGWVRVDVPYVLFEGNVGDITDFYYGASQVAISQRGPSPFGGNGTLSPLVVDTVRDPAIQWVLCGAPESEDGSASATRPARMDKAVPAAPPVLVLVGLVCAARLRTRLS